MTPDEYSEWWNRMQSQALGDIPRRTIPRESLPMPPEPMSWWKYVLGGLSICLFAGVLLWSVLDDIKALDEQIRRGIRAETR